MKSVRVWDLPLRLFHWLLVAAVATAVLTGEIGGNLMDWHGKIGLYILGLVLFRLLWGFIGNEHARFMSFFPTPAKLRAHLRGEWQGLGHNPLGALSVFALIGVLALQAGTGLFGNDDIAFQGPLYRLVGSAWSERLTGLHEITGNLLIGLVILHVSAIAFYARVKKINLVLPMITGKAAAEGVAEGAGSQRPKGGGILAFLVAVAIAMTIVWLIGSGNLVQWLAPEPPPAVGAPAW